MPHLTDLGSDYLNTLLESSDAARDPLDLLLEAEEQAIQEWHDTKDRPDFKRVGRKQYVARRRAYLIDTGAL